MWAAVGAPSIQPIAHRRNVVAYAAVAGAAAAASEVLDQGEMPRLAENQPQPGGGAVRRRVTPIYRHLKTGEPHLT